jgi:tRNA threonylcarbamoyladenosine biosynthesis protein TsaE
MGESIEVVGAERMAELGAQLGKACRSGDVIALVGELGAGKTVLAQGLARGLGVPDDVPITSPTFTLVNEYQHGRLTLHHVDLYRLERAAELEHVGLWDLYRGDGVVVVEWFDRFPEVRPRELLELRIGRIAGREDARRVDVIAHGAAGTRLAHALTSTSTQGA